MNQSATKPQSLLQEYMSHTSGTESPKTFHRWAFLSCVAAQLGRNIWIPFGHGRIYPNMYVMLVGVPAARKSTSIVIAQRLLAAAKYRNFSFTKSTREKFLLDFEQGFEVSQSVDKGNIAQIMAQESSPIDKLDLLNQLCNPQDPISEAFVCCDEFADFIGQKNINFINTFTTLWDNKDNYPERLKNSKSVNIIRPTVNILGGITPTSFSTAMPQEIVGQGFMSRLILVYGEPNKVKITWPTPPSELGSRKLALRVRELRKLHGECKLTPTANSLIDRIYQNYYNIPDARLQYYCARRLDHLLKLCMIVSAMKGTTEIDYASVEEANTILVYTENAMPRALGEFGEAKNAKATQKVIECLSDKHGPVDISELWMIVCQDLNRITELQDILQNLQIANKIIHHGSSVLLNRAPQTKNVIGVNFAKYIPEASTLNPEDLL